MRTSKFTVEQIAQALRRVEGGVAAAEVCRDLGITETTFYRWKQKFGGLGTPELRELRQLRDENRRLKPMVADLTLDRTMLQETLRKQW
jgi:putative transposase